MYFGLAVEQYFCITAAGLLPCGYSKDCDSDQLRQCLAMLHTPAAETDQNIEQHLSSMRSTQWHVQHDCLRRLPCMHHAWLHDNCSSRHLLQQLPAPYSVSFRSMMLRVRYITSCCLAVPAVEARSAERQRGFGYSAGAPLCLCPTPAIASTCACLGRSYCLRATLSLATNARQADRVWACRRKVISI